MANYEAQVHSAKAFLLQSSAESKNNLYDHLSDCLTRILDERTPNAIDMFENISNSVKQEKLQPLKDTLQDQQGPSERADLAEKQKQLFGVTDAPDLDGDEEVSIPFPDLMDISKCLEGGGIGLNREEMFRISLAMKQLTQTQPLLSSRFWGKVFGTKRDYLVVETEFQEGEGEDEGEGSETGEGGDKDEEEEDEGDDLGSEAEKDEPPQSQWKPLPTVPKEEAKTGTNKKTYFVCNNPGDQWVKLPHITPAQVSFSRYIRKLFTGVLNTPIVSFPPFPGNESNYLRAQIARISATTQISPSSYFQSPEDEEMDEEEEEGIGIIEPNPEFEVGKVSEYADINNWCHYIPYLLPQGRTTWWNPLAKADDELEADDDDDEEEKEQLDEPEPESGPPLLTSAAEDAKVDGMPAWSARLSSTTLPHYAVAIVSSNLWPGAHSYTAGRKFENIYIGWGLKYSSRSFNPELPPPVQEEFPAGADITEGTDPTVEQEAALKAAQAEAQADMDEEEEPEESDED